MTQVDPNRYEKYIIYEKGLPVVYMRLKRMVPSTKLKTGTQDRTAYVKFIQMEILEFNGDQNLSN